MAALMVERTALQRVAAKVVKRAASKAEKKAVLKVGPKVEKTDVQKV